MNNSKQQLHTVTGVISSLQSSLAPPPQSVLMAKPAPTSCTLLPSVVTQGFIVCWGYGLRRERADEKIMDTQRKGDKGGYRASDQSSREI
ncbi:hypothetical protein BASA50_010870 [Batrachochytrium salamandrivorans]|uniref:Uncharacterized protein n=1 Tax=Batrachochytrium salamandrivorans TaxID=1357716 RepID=A0ABQ8EXD1_9FUNG|nr:hypothetical protein BASA61_006760 [Batrachochytrium salamandrivorans]KAH6588181.1 hypothetical protein BASA50_010862 [Batrachochytrium salamandrivorans]KAH6588189.1 hypothetical protein BASA50_010870 [Batrachochytrium salamandrivorans]